MPWTGSRLCRASPGASSSSACGCCTVSAACLWSIVAASFIDFIHSEVGVALFILVVPIDALKGFHQRVVCLVNGRIERHAVGALVFPVAADLAEMPERKVLGAE